MPANDIYHDAFVRALQKEGWTITHDPLTIAVDGANLLIDVGAERVVAAQRGNERIAVEIKSFLSRSSVQDLKEAAGQYLIYDMALRQSAENADRILYLAVRAVTYDAVFQVGVGRLVLQNRAVRLIVFDEEREEITQWIQ